MLKTFFVSFFFMLNSLFITARAQDNNSKTDPDIWVAEFNINPEDLSSIGENEYFILKPGYQLILKGEDDGEEIVLIITVLNQTKVVDGVLTRVVEEKETKNGKLIEVSMNYFAIDNKNKNIYYFGESVDIYKNDKVVSHEGAWVSGEDGAKFGLMIPGRIKPGEKYYQEIAPDIAMDRAEIISAIDELVTPAGKFINCLKIKETTPMEPKALDYKIYAPGIGLIKDGTLLLKEYSFQ